MNSQKSLVAVLLLSITLFALYVNNWYFPIAIKMEQDKLQMNSIGMKNYKMTAAAPARTTTRPGMVHQQGIPWEQRKYELMPPSDYPGRNKSNGQWVRLPLPNNFEMYVYSSFYDDRVSLGTLPVVRTIVVSEDVDDRTVYCCLYYKRIKKFKFVVMNTLAIGMGASKHGRYLKEYIFTCDLNAEDKPDEVTFTFTRSTSSADVRIPVESPWRPPDKHPYGVCVSVSYWHFEPVRIIEWLELQRILGAGLVTIYNNSLEPDAAAVFEYYDKLGLVDFRQSHNFISDPGESTFHLHMSPVINDCMYRNMYRFEMIAVIDLDEMIIPKKNAIMASMLHTLKTKSYHPAPGFSFRNAYFFQDFPPDVSKPSYTSTLRQRTRVDYSQAGYSAKSIINPLACINMHNHYCWGHTPLYSTSNNNIEVSPEVAALHHYKKCHFDSIEKPGTCANMMSNNHVDDTMLRLESRLLKTIRPRLKDLGYLK